MYVFLFHISFAPYYAYKLKLMEIDTTALYNIVK
jgi:hypothetical protein